MEGMSRFRGHFFNWYDTRTLSILPAPYVSSVDSGNLAGLLVALSSGLRGLGARGRRRAPAPAAEGVGDTLAMLRDRLAALPTERRALRDLRASLDHAVDGFADTLTPGLPSSPGTASLGWSQLGVLAAEIQRLTADLVASLPDDETATRWPIGRGR